METVDFGRFRYPHPPLGQDMPERGFVCRLEDMSLLSVVELKKIWQDEKLFVILHSGKSYTTSSPGTPSDLDRSSGTGL